jgi:psp operon transcriptional activator
LSATRDPVSIVGESPAFVSVLEQVSGAAPLNRPVLILGERGTGKELIASRLHFLSGRWEQPLVKVNCAALTESLLESELFGHEAGAFTGAAARHVGRFERADGGTLLLDELGTIPVRMQETILRVIEYGEFERVGGSDTVRVDVRIIGATNDDLPKLAAAGRFRRDLLDRLAFDVVHVPPLRERPEDILLLADHFAVNFTAELRRAFFPGFTRAARDALLAHDWPGNVRELKNTVERSLYRTENTEEPVDSIAFDPFRSPFAASSPGSGPREIPVDLPTNLKSRLAEMERRYVTAALARHRWNRRRAAAELGLTYDQIRGSIQRLGLREGRRLATVRPDTETGPGPEDTDRHC